MRNQLLTSPPLAPPSELQTGQVSEVPAAAWLLCCLTAQSALEPSAAASGLHRLVALADGSQLCGMSVCKTGLLACRVVGSRSCYP